MSLFRNTADLKKFVDIHKETDWETLKPYVEQAESDYIIPFLSKAEYDAFDQQINISSSNNRTVDEIFGQGLRLELFKIIARALANFALYEAFPFLNTAVGDAGVQQLQSNGGVGTPAAQWRYESRRTAHLNTADTYSDKMLEFLEKHPGEFYLWAASDSFTVNKDLLISNSSMLAEYIGTNDSRRAYIAIRPYIRLAEKQSILPIIGKELYDELKSQSITNPSTVSTANQKLLTYVKEAIAWTAYYNAIPFLSLRINGDGIQIVSKNDSINSRSAATKEEKDEARAQAGRFSDSFLNGLKQFMDLNMEAYPLYKSLWLKTYPVRTYSIKRNKSGSGHFAV